MEMLVMLPPDLLGDNLSIVPVKLQQFMDKQMYAAIVSQSIEETLQQLGISIQNDHPLVFDKLYDRWSHRNRFLLASTNSFLGLA